MGTKINRIGQKFGRLLVIKECNRDKHKKIIWECLCDCGNIIYPTSGDLVTGNTTSCGCSKIDRLKTHMKSKLPEFQVWSALKQRCINPNDFNFNNYGGRGIDVCDRWLHSFENFIKDMGERPGKNYQIERIDNNKGYNPENCKWATRKEQNKNKRTNRWLDFNGTKKILKEWATYLQIDATLLRAYLKRHTIGDAIEFYSSKKPIT